MPSARPAASRTRRALQARSRRTASGSTLPRSPTGGRNATCEQTSSALKASRRVAGATRIEANPKRFDAPHSRTSRTGVRKSVQPMFNRIRRDVLKNASGAPPQQEPAKVRRVKECNLTVELNRGHPNQRGFASDGRGAGERRTDSGRCSSGRRGRRRTRPLDHRAMAAPPTSPVIDVSRTTTSSAVFCGTKPRRPLRNLARSIQNATHPCTSRPLRGVRGSTQAAFPARPAFHLVSAVPAGCGRGRPRIAKARRRASVRDRPGRRRASCRAGNADVDVRVRPTTGRFRRCRSSTPRRASNRAQRPSFPAPTA